MTTVELEDKVVIDDCIMVFVVVKKTQKKKKISYNKTKVLEKESRYDN